MITATRRFQFCCGHRVFEHGSKCRHMHGHNYVAFVTCEAQGLDKLGMVIDFSVIKEKIGGWIDQNWDHGFVYFHKDISVRDSLLAFEVSENPRNGPEEAGYFTQKIFALDSNPTAENMAAWLLKVGNNLLNPDGVRVVEVVLYETENCYATVKADDPGRLTPAQRSALDMMVPLR